MVMGRSITALESYNLKVNSRTISSTMAKSSKRMELFIVFSKMEELD